MHAAPRAAAAARTNTTAPNRTGGPTRFVRTRRTHTNTARPKHAHTHKQHTRTHTPRECTGTTGGRARMPTMCDAACVRLTPTTMCDAACDDAAVVNERMNECGHRRPSSCRCCGSRPAASSSSTRRAPSARTVRRCVACLIKKKRTEESIIHRAPSNARVERKRNLAPRDETWRLSHETCRDVSRDETWRGMAWWCAFRETRSAPRRAARRVASYRVPRASLTHVIDARVVPHARGVRSFRETRAGASDRSCFGGERRAPPPSSSVGFFDGFGPL